MCAQRTHSPDRQVLLESFRIGGRGPRNGRSKLGYSVITVKKAPFREAHGFPMGDSEGLYVCQARESEIICAAV
jgi:hypothetical protein